jgi:hypothetical protein
MAVEMKRDPDDEKLGEEKLIFVALRNIFDAAMQKGDISNFKNESCCTNVDRKK